MSQLCSLTAHHNPRSTKAPGRPQHPQRSMKKEIWALLTRLSPAGQGWDKLCCAGQCSLCCPSPAGDSFPCWPLVLPCVRRVCHPLGLSRAFQHIPCGLAVRAKLSSNPTGRETQEHNLSSTTQLWGLGYATVAGEIGGGSTELNLSLSLQFLALGQADPSRKPKSCDKQGNSVQLPWRRPSASFLVEAVWVLGRTV